MFNLKNFQEKRKWRSCCFCLFWLLLRSRGVDHGLTFLQSGKNVSKALPIFAKVLDHTLDIVPSTIESGCGDTPMLMDFAGAWLDSVHLISTTVLESVMMTKTPLLVLIALNLEDPKRSARSFALFKGLWDLIWSPNVTEWCIQKQLIFWFFVTTLLSRFSPFNPQLSKPCKYFFHYLNQLSIFPKKCRCKNWNHSLSFAEAISSNNRKTLFNFGFILRRKKSNFSILFASKALSINFLQSF